MNRKTLLLVAVAGLAVAGPTSAQEDRARLIEQARGEFDESAQLDLLMRAADPTTAPPDSVWAVGVYDLALALTGMDDMEQAELWLRFAARHRPGSPIDRSWFPESLVQAYDRAVGVVTRAPDRTYGGTDTRWTWPGGFDADAPGRIEIQAAAGLDLDVTVEGRGGVPVGGATELPPGTYELEASAPGHEPVRLTREVLPGVTTVLSVDLPPELPEDVRSRVASGLVSIRAGGDVCVDGVLRPDGLILTSLSALPRTIGLRVEMPGGATHGDVAVVERDMRRDLAVLRLDTEAGAPLADAGGTPGEAWAWTVYHAGCGPPATAATRLEGGAAGADPMELAAAVDAEAVGGPLVDLSGGLLGIVVGPTQVVRLAGAQELLAQALAAPAGTTPEAQAAEAGGGGFPLKWVAAGVGVVGVAALVAGGGGGNGNGPPVETKTGIRITLPGGTP